MNKIKKINNGLEYYRLVSANKKGTTYYKAIGYRPLNEIALKHTLSFLNLEIGDG